MARWLPLLAALLCPGHPAGTHAASPDVSGPVRAMPLAEQAGQLTQLDINLLLDPHTGAVREAEVRRLCRERRVGSVFNTPRDRPLGRDAWLTLTGTVRRLCEEAGGPPLLFAIDSVHGANYITNATLFPQQVGLAATFRPELAWRQGRVTARETRAAGLEWIFAPILGIATQPAWARVYETFGEDPHLAAVMGAALVRGIQGDPLPPAAHEAVLSPGDQPSTPSAGPDEVPLAEDLRCAATMKHFIGYSNSLTGQDRTPVWIPDPALLQYYVPPFEAAVKAGVLTAMEAYTELNGVPVVTSQKYLRRLLRDHLGFEGVLVTDYNEVDNAWDWHRAAPSALAATAAVLRDTSVDVAMVPWKTTFPDDVQALVLSGAISRDRVMESVGRVQRLKGRLLSAPPRPDPKRCWFACAAHRRTAAEVAAESLTLLQNRGDALPLRRAGHLLLLGAAADSLVPLAGGWTFHWQGAEADDEFSYGATLKEALEARDVVRRVRHIAAVCPANTSVPGFGGSRLHPRWNFRDDTGAGRLEAHNGQARVTLRAPSPNVWSVALEHTPITLEHATQYLVTATALASGPAMLTLKLGAHRPPWPDLVLKSTPVGSAVTRLELEYFHRAETCVDDCGLYLFFAPAAPADLPVTVTVQSVTITPVRCATEAAVAEAAAAADAVVAVVGEWPYTERPGDISDLALPRAQGRLVRAAAGAARGPLVLVLVEGRPRLLQGLAELSAAVLHAYLPGPAGGAAVADVLLGRASPSGRLPYSYPRTPGNAPLQYWHKPAVTYDVQWPFGTGLSYTRFEYSDLAAAVREAGEGEVVVTVAVRNAGSVPSAVAVLVYVSQAYRPTTPEARLLVAFQKVELVPSQSAHLRFSVPFIQLSYFDEDCCRRLAPGDFTAHVEELSAPFLIPQPRTYGCSPMTRPSARPADEGASPSATLAWLALLAVLGGGGLGAGAWGWLRRRRGPWRNPRRHRPLENVPGAEELEMAES